MSRPNFLIVGAGKSGTTTLADWLRQHPQVFIPAVKELNYFAGIPDLLGRPNKTWGAYLSNFEPAGDAAAIGEASPSYLSTPDAAARIRDRLPDVKIIILLRNPVDRAFSSYHGAKMGGRDRHTTFERAIDDAWKGRLCGMNRRERTVRQLPDCVSGSFYFDSVRRYIDLFGKQQVRVWRFEEMVREIQWIFLE